MSRRRRNSNAAKEPTVRIAFSDTGSGDSVSGDAAFNAASACWCVAVALAWWIALTPTTAPGGCTTVMVAKGATTDGAVLMASSCDGDVMGLVYVMPAKHYEPNTKLPMYRNLPRPETYQQYVNNVKRGYELVGLLPIQETYRTMLFAGNVENMITGGVNEHGVSIAIEFLPMRAGLACSQGAVGPNSNHWSTSLIANGLMRAKTAREAIQIIGSMVEQYGFLYYRAPGAGVAIPIADDQEVWLMEIFGPGKEWTRDSGRPGGVWCAQRVPEGHVACSANRSRIGKVDLKDAEHFLASSNIFSLAAQLGFWKRGEPFVWHDVYGAPSGRSSCLREWRALSLFAPSLDLAVTDDPQSDRYPFSVKAEHSVNVSRLIQVMRDSYEGTPFDLTEHPNFRVAGKKSPLARPSGPPELFDLLKIKPERTISTPTSGYVFVAQLRDHLPNPIGTCVWFAYGPANTSCFVPIYAGITQLPNTWNRPADFTRIDRRQAQWNFRLVHNLANVLPFQRAMRDITRMIEPAEARFAADQAAFEQRALGLWREDRTSELETLLNDYATQCMTCVGDTYSEMVDYLMLQYLVGYDKIAPPKLPRVSVPNLPGHEVNPVSKD